MEIQYGAYFFNKTVRKRNDCHHQAGASEPVYCPCWFFALFLVRKEATSRQLNNAYEQACGTAKIKKRLPIYTNPLITSPMLVGFCTPFLVLPDMHLEETDLYYIFVHELTHYKRRDILYKWAVQIVICLHWFNPFVYCMRKKLDKDCELSCDEMVIRAQGAPEKRAYGDTLLHAVRKNSSYTNSIVSVTLN